MIYNDKMPTKPMVQPELLDEMRAAASTVMKNNRDHTDEIYRGRGVSPAEVLEALRISSMSARNIFVLTRWVEELLQLNDDLGSCHV